MSRSAWVFFIKSGTSDKEFTVVPDRSFCRHFSEAEGGDVLFGMKCCQYKAALVFRRRVWMSDVIASRS